MKKLLTRTAISFTIVTLFLITFFGYFHDWEVRQTNIWGIAIGISIATNIVYSRFFEKRGKA